MPDAFIYDHVRTPRGRGKADGALHEVTALNLAAQTLAAIKQRNALDTATASMAKYRLTDLLGTIVDRCLQLFCGYGYMDEYPISRLYRDARVMRIYAGTNEIMKLLIARGL